ncbi:MerR-like helix-turn-helix DNA binding domain protein [Arthrobacter phage Aoka]|nr:MerR-like helix-turn-helix DNA binding domain protein [Arthrobacter phage Aoka]
MAGPVKLYSYGDLAERSGLDAATLRVWKSRGKLPEPDFEVGQSPAWTAETAEAWIRTLPQADPPEVQILTLRAGRVDEWSLLAELERVLRARGTIFVDDWNSAVLDWTVPGPAR